MNRGIAYVFLLLLSCSKDPATTESLQRIERTVERHAAQLSEAEGHLKSLGTEWNDIRQHYLEAAMRYRATQSTLEDAALQYGRASDKFVAVSLVAEETERRWRLFGQLVVAAAMIDAANLDAVRAGQGQRAADSLPANCNAGISTAAFRVMLAARGVALDGMDIDHIVPRSLGGADHPDNYQVLPASVNRSIGNTWNEQKCFAVGSERCSKAITASRKCGSLKGIGF